jgi:hypothetical protein
MKKGAPANKGLPTNLGGKADYAARFYRNELKNFLKKSRSSIKRINADADKPPCEIIEEHRELRSSFW